MVPRQARSSDCHHLLRRWICIPRKNPGGPPMIRLTAFVAAVLIAAPAVAITPVIDELTPNHYQAKSGEHFLTIRGNALFVPPAVTTVIFSGGAGTFELTASSQSYTALTVWVPQEIINRIGRYTVRVRVVDATKTLE